MRQHFSCCPVSQPAVYNLGVRPTCVLEISRRTNAWDEIVPVRIQRIRNRNRLDHIDGLVGDSSLYQTGAVRRCDYVASQDPLAHGFIFDEVEVCGAIAYFFMEKIGQRIRTQSWPGSKYNLNLGSFCGGFVAPPKKLSQRFSTKIPQPDQLIPIAAQIDVVI